MKLHKKIDVQYTNKLFNNKFQYKVVFRFHNAGNFRGLTLAKINDKLSQKWFKGEEKFCKKLLDVLHSMDEFQIRVETPCASIYTNSTHFVEKLASIDSSKVKYVSVPDPNIQEILGNNNVVLKTLDFNFRVNLGQTKQNFSNFVEWAESNPKLKLPKRCKRELTKNWSNGGSYFYVKDEKVLTMVKMFLGRTITKIETVVKA